MKRSCRFGFIMMILLCGSAIAQDSTDIIGHVRLDSSRNTWHATLACNDGGLWFCAWTERTQSGAAIRGAFLQRGQRQDLNLIDVSRPAPGSEDDSPAAAFLTDSTVLVVWQRSSGGRNVVTACALHRDGGMTATINVANDSAPGMMPAAGRNAAGEVVVAWQDYRNGDVDIYAQRFDAMAHPVGPNVRINDDDTHALQGQPRVAADNSSSFLLLWPDNRDDGAWKFYYHRLGSLNARNVLIDSAQRKAMTTIISGVGISGDSALFAWKD
ncbi:MAG: hypothetical protein WC824_01425, partial [Bacteroidota bacterium]